MSEKGFEWSENNPEIPELLRRAIEINAKQGPRALMEWVRGLTNREAWEFVKITKEVNKNPVLGLAVQAYFIAIKIAEAISGKPPAPEDWATPGEWRTPQSLAISQDRIDEIGLKLFERAPKSGPLRTAPFSGRTRGGVDVPQEIWVEVQIRAMALDGKVIESHPHSTGLIKLPASSPRRPAKMYSIVHPQ